MNKVSAQDWNIAQKLGVQGNLAKPLYWKPVVNSSEFDPAQLVEINE
jgi:hypothetical protein